MPYQLVKFTCKYCGREYKLEKNAEEHEKKCYHNEANRACVTCANFKAYPVISDPYGNSRIARCSKLLDEEFYEYGYNYILRNHCNGWEKRTVKGTYNYGKTKLEESD